jgi:hypothetical protein
MVAGTDFTTGTGILSFEGSGVEPLVKRGRKLKDPSASQVGWPFDPAWEKPILEGCKRHAHSGNGYKRYMSRYCVQVGSIRRQERHPKMSLSAEM